MAFRILRDETVEAAIRRIAREEIDGAIQEIDDCDLSGHETVHQVRKRCKKIRGLIRLARPSFDGYAAENRRFRDAARSLSEIRDATTRIECLDALTDRYHREIDRAPSERLRGALVARRESVAASCDLASRLGAFRAEMESSRDRVDRWSFAKEDFAAISGGLKGTYGRTRKAMRRAYARPSAERFHEWRKSVKYNRYHAQLLCGIWEPVMEPVCRELETLSDLLGEAHDLVVMRALLDEAPDALGPPRESKRLLDLMERRRERLLARARPVGRRLYAEKPACYVARMGTIWDAWQSERKLG